MERQKPCLTALKGCCWLSRQFWQHVSLAVGGLRGCVPMCGAAALPCTGRGTTQQGWCCSAPQRSLPLGGGGRQLSNPGGEDGSAVRNKCVSYCLKCSFWLKTICFFDACLICLWNELMISESCFLILNMCLLMQARRQQDPSPGSNLGSGDDLKLR